MLTHLWLVKFFPFIFQNQKLKSLNPQLKFLDLQLKNAKIRTRKGRRPWCAWLLVSTRIMSPWPGIWPGENCKELWRRTAQLRERGKENITKSPADWGSQLSSGSVRRQISRALSPSLMELTPLLILIGSHVCY